MKIRIFLCFSSFFKFQFIFYVLVDWKSTRGNCWGYFLCAREMARLHLLVGELRMPLFSRDDMVQISFSQSFVTILEVVAGDDVRLFDLSWVSFINWCFLICSIFVLFKWLTALVSAYGDVLWHKLEAIRLGYESLGYIGKRHVIQRWEETFDHPEIHDFLVETEGI